MAAPRKDAQRNREALVTAAERIFSEQGVGAPLAEIASAAGVGRATQQRHFAQRHLLAAAVYDRHLDRIDTLVSEATETPGGLKELLRQIIAGQRKLAGLFPLMRSTPQAADSLVALGNRLNVIFTAPLAAARSRGEVATSVSIDDLRLVLTMAEGVLASYDGREQELLLDRCLDIAYAGLRDEARPCESRTGLRDAFT